LNTATVSKALLSLLLLLFTAPGVNGGLYRVCSLKIVNSSGTSVSAEVEIADSWQQRQHGLMFRRVLDKNRGMLFIFPDSRRRSFWMKNTHVPLSVAYIDEKGAILRILDMKPLDISITYDSGQPARYALEMNRGWFRKNKIRKGCRVLLNGCIGQ